MRLMLSVKADDRGAGGSLTKAAQKRISSQHITLLQPFHRVSQGGTPRPPSQLPGCGLGSGAGWTLMRQMISI